VSVLIDSEKSGAGQLLSNERAAFVESCLALQMNVHVTDRRATENYLTDEAIKKVKGTAFRALEPFEKFTELEPRWGKGDNWRIAQNMDLATLMATDVGRWLSQLANAS
jgi:hypothetical protein